MQSFLYRYKKVDEYSLEGLERNEFYFSSPSDFNDPFDCKNLFTFDGSDDNDWRLFFDMQLQHQAPYLSAQERRKKVELIIQNEKHKDPEAKKEQSRRWGKILEEESNKLGVVCLSHKPDDILMWSHYSDKHSGFCLKFDKKLIKKTFYGSDVEYSQVYPTFTNFVEELVQSGIEKVYKTFLLTKSIHWKHEEEYRLINDPSSRNDQPGERKYKYPEEALFGIIWGCQMLEKDKEKIKTVFKYKSHSISYYQATKSESEYAIKILPA